MSLIKIFILLRTYNVLWYSHYNDIYYSKEIKIKTRNLVQEGYTASSENLK